MALVLYSRLDKDDTMKLLEICSKEQEEVTFKGKKVQIGKHDSVPDSKFDAKQLAKGIKVELEHTKDSKLAKSIAKDHLKEDPKYYDKLEKVEGK